MSYALQTLWHERARNKPKSYPDMTLEEQQAFRALLDREMPRLGR